MFNLVTPKSIVFISYWSMSVIFQIFFEKEEAWVRGWEGVGGSEVLGYSHAR